MGTRKRWANKLHDKVNRLSENWHSSNWYGDRRGKASCISREADNSSLPKDRKGLTESQCHSETGGTKKQNRESLRKINSETTQHTLSYNRARWDWQFLFIPSRAAVDEALCYKYLLRFMSKRHMLHTYTHHTNTPLVPVSSLRAFKAMKLCAIYFYPILCRLHDATFCQNDTSSFACLR